ncbi:MAG: DUF1476 domain-containing protein [Novosphingobium sp.]
MTNFNDRERAEEAKFAMDEDTQFRVTARRNRLLGQWAAQQMGLSDVEAEAYAKAVVQADFEDAGDEEEIRQLLASQTSAGLAVAERDIRGAMLSKMISARRALMG